MIASVAVAAAVYAIDKPYSYFIPVGLSVQPGMRVIVPFGRSNRKSEAIVLSVSAQEQDGLKPIERVMDTEPVLSEGFIRMAAFLRERYFCTFYDAMKAMLPAGLWFDMAETFTFAPDAEPKIAKVKAPEEQAIGEYVRNACSPVSRIDLQNQFPQLMDLDLHLQHLQKKKILQSNLNFSQKIQDKSEEIASLLIPAEEAMEFVSKKKKNAPMQCEVLKLLCAIGSGSVKEICYLTGANRGTIRRLENLGLIGLSLREVFRTPLPASVEAAEPLILNDEQQGVFKQLQESMQSDMPGISLLHGVTGSGKTAVYIQLIQQSLEHNRSSILLVPEIALTPQLIQNLMSHFGREVAVLHSGLRVTERYDEWKRIRQGSARVVIGTRSAVFAPVQNLGLLIVDEEQEHSYKSENAPRYHAREVAIYRGSKEHALVVLGSATPSVETMHLAKTGVYAYHALRNRYNGKDLPSVEIVDLKQEIRGGNATSLSLPLQQALEDNIRNEKQSILFLNRRGAGRYMICVDCGEVPQCPRCSVSLTYHKANGRLMCHYCGYSHPVQIHCSSCGGPMKIIGTGTQKIEQELQERFPDTRTLRMDADTISASNNHEMVLERFEKEKIPILVGTQMVTKGLNFENVTLVGVIDADLSLYVNHFRAAESTFSMLTQVIGRAGRGAHAGRALIQTMTPEHSVIRLAAYQDYDTFFAQEITIRRLHRFPPFGDLMTVLFMGLFERDTLAAAERFRQQLEKTLRENELWPDAMQILGPSPASVAKINNSYRFRLMLQCDNTRLVRLLLAQLLKTFMKDKTNKGINVLLDVHSYE